MKVTSFVIGLIIGNFLAGVMRRIVRAGKKRGSGR